MQMYLLEELEAHPQNPRQQNQEVVESLTAQMVADGFGEQHAILIRPLDGRFQIVSGHHRVAAAWKAELKEVPAICKEMDDEEAYMQLLLCNTQTGLTALERGLHALNCIALSGGGKGNEGGLREYARRVGCSKSEISRLRQAAEVFKVSPRGDSKEVSTRVLSELHKLPEPEWKPTLRKAIDQEWTVAKTIDKVKEMRGIEPKVIPEPEVVVEPEVEHEDVELDDYAPAEEPDVAQEDEETTDEDVDYVMSLGDDAQLRIYEALKLKFG